MFHPKKALLSYLCCSTRQRSHLPELTLETCYVAEVNYFFFFWDSSLEKKIKKMHVNRTDKLSRVPVDKKDFLFFQNKRNILKAFQAALRRVKEESRSSGNVVLAKSVVSTSYVAPGAALAGAVNQH